MAALLRPGLEYLLKGAVDRPRPNIDPLGTFHGPSHPSGHPLAAASLWGLVPAVVALHVHSRALWWATVGMASAIITGVAAARVYKGAHYLTDVTASLAWAATATAQTPLTVSRVGGAGPFVDPSAPAWKLARPVKVAMLPQTVTRPNHPEPAIRELTVRAADMNHVRKASGR